MPAAQIKMQVERSCAQCAYRLGGHHVDMAMYCGFQYFQQPARERKVVKLNCFPPVSAQTVCQQWASSGNHFTQNNGT